MTPPPPRAAAAEDTLVRVDEGRRLEPDLAGGRLNAAIARAIVAIQRVHVGRGPTKAHAFFRDNIVVVVMRDVMTRAERNLVAAGREEAVLELRRHLQATMAADLTGAVEELTGCRVVALMSDNDVRPDVAAETFVLDRPVPSTGRGASGVTAPATGSSAG